MKNSSMSFSLAKMFRLATLALLVALPRSANADRKCVALDIDFLARNADIERSFKVVEDTFANCGVGGTLEFSVGGIRKLRGDDHSHRRLQGCILCDPPPCEPGYVECGWWRCCKDTRRLDLEEFTTMMEDERDLEELTAAKVFGSTKANCLEKKLGTVTATEI
uniref:Uncharacterized protein n=1 Tax=Pseudictyota dubia TaxID=2749911 RepID=A0A7R9WFF6_9STRA|mmetsp:Transcript_48547/g.90086  ORF Transcript_48547/g.90086 Transcript_48547/m.90086 type:complete len:164 (+) Transcript_48547:273-764(+)